MRISFLNVSRLMAVSVVLLLTLNGMFLWRDYQNKRELASAQLMLYDTRIKLRALETERLFGASFIPEIKTVDLDGNDATISEYGNQITLLLFFRRSDCRVCLEAMTSFKSTISDNIPVVGITPEESLSEIQTLVHRYEYQFPILKAIDMPFDLIESPYCVLIDRHRNVRYLSKINPAHTPVSVQINEITSLTERR